MSAFEYDPDGFGSRDYQRLRHMADADDFESVIDWAVNDAIHYYGLDPEELLPVMEDYTDAVREAINNE